MFRLLLISSLFLASSEAFACPMADAAAFQEAAEQVAAAKGTKTSFTLTGMTCGSCSDKVADALKGTDGVILAAVDYQTGRVDIAFDDKKVDKKALESVLANTGFALVQKPS